MMDASDDKRLEATLARVLKAGTLVAASVIALGLALQWFGIRPMRGGTASAGRPSIVTVGLAIFLLLPCLRVLIMMVVFVRCRDYRFGAVAAIVLLIILIAFSIGALAPAEGV